ncbi:MAG: hypothetical protein ACOX20_04750 [Limnochordia bacterium]
MLVNLTPRPVRLTTPMMMPAMAQDVAIMTAPVAPASKALKIFCGVILVSFRTMVTTEGRR